MSSPRYEREIRSLLEGLDNFLPDEPSRGRRARQNRDVRASNVRRSGEPMQAVVPGAVIWLLRYPFYAAVLLIVMGRFIFAPLPGIGPIAALSCGVGAVALVVLIMYRAINRVRYGAPFERVWRGEVVDGPSSRISKLLARWWTRLGGGR